MVRELSTKRLIDRVTLEEIGQERLAEATVLVDAEHYAGAIYLAGYAVECYLKAAICAALRWSELRTTFAVHDLEALLDYTGLEPELRQAKAVRERFNKIQGMWREGRIRYQRPGGVSKVNAEEFLSWVGDDAVGVVPWVKKQI